MVENEWREDEMKRSEKECILKDGVEGEKRGEKGSGGKSFPWQGV